MTSDEMFQTEERILKIYHKQDENEITSAILDHIQLLIFLKDAPDVQQKREKMKIQNTGNKDTKQRKQSNLETAKILFKTYINSQILPKNAK